MPVRLVSHEELPGPLKGYRLLERLGRGGFGEVWKCEAPGGLLKAVKFVFGDLDAMDEESRPAEQEAKALERVKGIRHPYILSLEQFRVIDGQLIIVMELADRNLWDRFRECRGQGLPGIPREELLSYMNEAAEALDLMNNYYQIQHLDIKPQNLFLVFNHIKVADFGLAKALEGIRATVTGGVTPVYAAPETFEGWVSRFSDQYSLAIVFQELLTGTRPFTGTNTRQLLMQHLNGTPEMSALSEGDRQAVGRALSKKPDDRWPTCTDLVQALKENGAPPVRAPGGARQMPGSGTRTAPAPVQHALADSVATTRPVPGGPLPVAAGDERARARTPPPSQLRPLVKPAGAPGSLPPLATPAGSQARLVTPLSVPGSSAGLNPAHTLSRNSVFQTARMGTLGVAPPERTGDGVLFPALVVALGHSGRMVVEALKRTVADRHGSAERVSNVRFLYLDTDADALGAAASADGALVPREVVPIRLNRSTHYLQREGLPNVEQWLPHGLLYKLPRNPGAANGVRAFGRLALVDNFRAVAQRVRQEVETFLSDDALNRTDQATRLGLRSNRPRAYVIAGLGGGTGGGAFLDVAFLLRRELKQVGFVRPEVVGQFFVPPPNSTTGRSFPLGNAYAALAEFHHFQSQRSVYHVAFEKSEGPITDDAPPFARAAVLQVPADGTRAGPVFAAAAHALYAELLTPAGRTADEAREVYRKAYPSAAPACQTFGLYRLNWPRPELLAAATRRLAHGLLTRWTGKEAVHLREPVTGWLNQQWAERGLSTEAVTGVLNAAARDSVREDPDRVFDAFIDPLTAGSRFDAAAAVTVLDHLLKLVGKPECEGEADPGSLFRALSARYDALVQEVETHVGVMAATFIEVPQYRLPGAEEAVRQFADRFKSQVEVLEPTRTALDREVRATYGKLLQALGALAATGAVAAVTRKANAAEVIEHLRAYPRARLRLHVLDLVLAVFRRLRANAPEYLRDINSCRAALADMCAEVGAPPPPPAPGPCATILPDGCRNLDEAADQFLAGLAPEDLLAFDQRLQKDMTRKFRGLGSICLKVIEKGPLFRTLLLTKAREFLDSKLDHSDAARVFVRSRTQPGSAEKQLAEAYDEAEPLVRLTNARAAQQLAVLAVPPGPAGERVQELARETLPDVDLVPAVLPDDICFYREVPQVPLGELPHLGGQAREAYLQMAGDHPAHSRADVQWQHPG